jgi:Carbohydrate binding domain (family 11)
MKRDARLLLLTFVVGAAMSVSAVACVPPGSRPESAQGAKLKECGPDGVIDDFEDNNNQISVIGDRGGYWYTYADKEGSTVWPEQGDKGGTFTVVEGGHESKFAVNVKGKLAGKSIVYAAMGLNFRDPKEAYDASMYEGITFWAKIGPGSTPKMLVKLPDGNTDPDGQVCQACFNDFGATVTLTNQWQRVVLPFRDLRQEGDWGAPRKPHADSKKLFAIHFEAKTPGSDYDFWVDDIAFVCKG